MASPVDALLPLPPRTLYVLLALAEEERHGYAISRSVEEMTNGSIRLTPGSLYPLMHQLLVDGWIAAAADDSGDTRRRTYKLTAHGRRIAQAELQRLESLVRMGRAFKLLPAAGRA